MVLDFSSLALDANEWRDVSYSLGNLKRYEEMLLACDRALAIDSNDKWSWNSKGRALFYFRRYSESITDNKGRLIDCSNTLFVMTSNLGAGVVDFRTAETDELRELAERFMRRELVNRISGVIGFRPLDREHLSQILDQIQAEKARLFETEKGLIVDVDRSARRVLLERGYSPDLGARPLERAVDEWVVQPLVDAWFANQLKTGRVRFTVAAQNVATITFTQD